MIFCCGRAPVGEMLWLLRWHALVLALDFAVTISVFPSVTAAICSVHNPATSPPCFPHVAAGRLAGAHVLTPQFNVAALYGITRESDEMM